MKSITTPPTVVWTNAGSGAPFKHPLTAGIEAAAIKTARAVIEVRLGSSADVFFQAYYEWSSDQKTWSNPTDIGEELETDSGMDLGTLGFETIVLTNSRRWLRFGVKVWNESGTDLNLAYVSLRIDMRGT